MIAKQNNDKNRKTKFLFSNLAVSNESKFDVISKSNEINFLISSYTHAHNVED